MTKTITKKQIIRALQTEPILKRGWWFHENTTKKKCAVCIVGCILRKMSFETWAKKRGLSTNTLGIAATKAVSCGRQESWKDYVLNYLEREKYLAALSIYFESGHGRKQCIAFVKRNFPAKLSITIQPYDMM